MAASMPWAPTCSPRRSRPGWRPRTGKGRNLLSMEGSPVPSIVVVADDGRVLDRLATDLARRFGAHYRILAEGSPTGALAALERPARGAEPVALAVAARPMEGR